MILDKRSVYRISVFLLIVLCCILALSLYLKANNLVINYTASYPPGLYKKISIDRDIRVGDWVMFCLPDNPITQLIIERSYVLSGRCEQGHSPLIKKVYAVGGDSISVSMQGISVNHGAMIKDTAPILKDAEGRVLPIIKNGRVQPGHYVLFSDYDKRSFDSRYFGTVNRESIFYFVESFLVMGERYPD